MSALDTDKKKREWKLTIGNSPQMRATFGSCRTTAVGAMDKLVQIATRSYPEKYDELVIARKEISETAMVGGFQEWSGELGGAKWRVRIEKI